MTRLELLKIVVGRARKNGFEFRRWYTTRLGVPWISAEAALTLLESQRRYYALLFSHEFAESFWKPGTEITFEVPGGAFQRRSASGQIITVQRKAFTRRSARPDAWRYHLRQMALADEPLRYVRKFLAVQEDLVDDDIFTATPAKRTRKPTVKAPRTRSTPMKRPMPTDVPIFLRRPYR